MGRGRSGAGKGKGKGGGGSPPISTPSGIDYQTFMSMTDAQKYQTMADIIANPNIKTPDYVDNSVTTKVLYGLGMNNKMTVVSDAQLDAMPGQDVYRTVYEQSWMPPPSTEAIADNLRNGDYTHMSGAGGSAHGRAIYFATDFGDSADYGVGHKNSIITRQKLSPNAKIVNESTLRNQVRADTTFNSQRFNNTDRQALWAIAHGIDGWSLGTYTMIVNRGVLTASSQNKRIGKTNRKTVASYSGVAASWSEAANAT